MDLHFKNTNRPMRTDDLDIYDCKNFRYLEMTSSNDFSEILSVKIGGNIKKSAINMTKTYIEVLYCPNEPFHNGFTSVLYSDDELFQLSTLHDDFLNLTDIEYKFRISIRIEYTDFINKVLDKEIIRLEHVDV